VANGRQTVATSTEINENQTFDPITAKIQRRGNEPATSETAEGEAEGKAPEAEKDPD